MEKKERIGPFFAHPHQGRHARETIEKNRVHEKKDDIEKKA
jgi:hypothetical protein